MSIGWKEIWDRYFYFGAGADKEIPPSITSIPDRHVDADYDVNFHAAAKQLLSDEPGVAGVFGTTDYISWISGAETSKENRIRTYREMEINSWVDDGLTEYVSAGMNADEKGETINLKLKNQDLSNNNNIRDNLDKEFEHVIKNVVNYDRVFAENFREFVLTGELAIELLIPNDNVQLRTLGVKGTKLLRGEQYVAYHDSSGNLEGFIVRNPYDQTVRIVASKDQIAYGDSGVYDYISGIGFGWAQSYIPSPQRVLRIPKSFIEAARKPYKQLDGLEDSAVIMRMSRAPQRLVFNVATGNLPKSKAEQYLQKLINKFRKKLTYNPDTGEVDQGQNVKNIMEDYWFVKDQSGKGTEVTTLDGATNLGEMEDINYFLNKLWRAMKIPGSRMNGEGVFEQNPGGISTQEIKFQKYVFMILKKYADIMKQIFIQHLKMKGIWQHYNLKAEDFEIVPVPPSYFTYMKNAEFLEAQFARFANFANNIDSETPIFARKTALKEGLGWTDEQISRNDEWLKEEIAAKAGAGGGEEGADMGSELGRGGAELGGGDADLGGGEEDLGI